MKHSQIARDHFFALDCGEVILPRNNGPMPMFLGIGLLIAAAMVLIAFAPATGYAAVGKLTLGAGAKLLVANGPVASSGRQLGGDVYMGDLYATSQNITFANGAILVDEWDPIIFDNLLRKFVVWDRIDKKPAVGDFTNGFQETDYGSARSADKRSMGFTPASPTRSARTPREIKAIVRDILFGLYDRSAYTQQGRKFGDLTGKDMQDVYNSMLNKWNDLFYNGSVNGNALEFDGLKALFTAAGKVTTVQATSSVIKAIQNKVVDLVKAKKNVRPTAILCNARVRQMITDEYLKAGAAIVRPSILPGQSGNNTGQTIPAIDTAVGDLPLIVDPFNTVVPGTPDVYPTFILQEDLVRWEYIEPLGVAGPEPKVFELPMSTAVDQQYKGLMFGAIDIFGIGDNHWELDIQDRTTVVNPAA